MTSFFYLCLKKDPYIRIYYVLRAIHPAVLNPNIRETLFSAAGKYKQTVSIVTISAALGHFKSTGLRLTLYYIDAVYSHPRCN